MVGGNVVGGSVVGTSVVGGFVVVCVFPIANKKEKRMKKTENEEEIIWKCAKL